MEKMEMRPEPLKVTAVDLKITVAVAVCVLTSTILNTAGLKFHYGEMQLEIIQKMTAAIACLLCCQDNMAGSKKAGINRLMITAIGGLVGILAVVIDIWMNNEWVMVLLVSVGVLLTLFLCKAAKVPYINARIGGITFILVSCTLTQYARVWYAVFRFLSTLYAVAVVLLVTWIFDRAGKNGV